MTFDPLAHTYDQNFTYTRTGAWLRACTQARMSHHWGRDDHVLELGGGTGEDARFLATRGVQITLTDASAEMLAVARAKNADIPAIQVARLDLAQLPDDDFRQDYDGVLANFGAINAIEDWERLGAWLAQRVKPQGMVMLGVMGRVCLWEIIWHMTHRDPKTAFRRLSGSARFETVTDTMTVYYPTPRQLTTAFSPYFTRTHLQGLGVFLPPSDVYGAIEKRPRVHQTLTQLERHAHRVGALAWLADHFWIEFRRD